MIASESLVKLAPALVAAQGEFESVAKSSENPFFKSRYADLPTVVQAAAPILHKNGLAVTQLLGADTLTTLLVHESGEFLGEEAIMHLTKEDPQGAGSATTYYRRYGYMAILGLVADVDDDGNASSALAASKAAHPSAQRPPEHRPSPLKVVDGAVAEDF